MTPMFDSGWVKIHHSANMQFAHGLGDRPNMVKVFGRESAEGPMYELIDMLVSADETVVVLNAKKLDLHCEDVRVECYIADANNMLWPRPEGTVPEKESATTPWLREVNGV